MRLYDVLGGAKFFESVISAVNDDEEVSGDELPDDQDDESDHEVRGAYEEDIFETDEEDIFDYSEGGEENESKGIDDIAQLLRTVIGKYTSKH